jgi:hypothetical protein
VLATGAPTPAVPALITGRVADFSACTASATTMPSSQLAQGFAVIQVEPSSSAAALVALKTTPPEAGRTTVWIASFTLSTTGTLSRTISAVSSTAMMASTPQLDSHA